MVTSGGIDPKTNAAFPYGTAIERRWSRNSPLLRSPVTVAPLRPMSLRSAMVASLAGPIVSRATARKR